MESNVPRAVLPPKLQLRPLRADDVDALLRIQAQCYGADFGEPREVFLQRLQSPLHCSWAAVQASTMVGYLAAYWSRPGAITPLHGGFASYADATVLYLHDMAVSPAVAGQGVARALLQAARTLARERGIRHTALVSVQGSQAYWERQGYAAVAVVDAAQQQHLASYGGGATYMVGKV
jgi:ribosomal protein S18 acetylase RimI-like enzyme